MIEPSKITTYDNSHFAVVDLGSNSFHLMISHLTPRLNNSNQVKVVNKVKRKVRLASGLDQNNLLSEQAIERGLDCLRLFALHLKTIPNENIIVVATAALRIAANSADFLAQANTILPKSIKLLSGQQEAKTIYAGVVNTATETSTTSGKIKRLVLDIGGASTEIILGYNDKSKALVSLNIGCVSYRKSYFSDNKLNEGNFSRAIAAASEEIMKIEDQFVSLAWDKVLGSSGTMQALAEILNFRQKPPSITLPFLYEVQQALIECKHIDDIILDGLRADRSPVLASGLCILIALFTRLNITELNLSCGALREGLLFSLLPKETVLLNS